MDQEKAVSSIKRAKVIVNTEDELTDILRKIESLEENRILLTFAEESDLLISPINLKVILETCDEHKKVLIMQIIQNPIGVRNARNVGIITTESPSDIDDDLWEMATNEMKERQEKMSSALKGKRTYIAPNEVVNEVSNDGEPSEYQKKIHEVIERSKQELNVEKNKKVIQEEGFVFAIDQDIANQKTTPQQPVKTMSSSLVGKDFNKVEAGKVTINTKPVEQKDKVEKVKKPFPFKKVGKIALLIFGILLVLSSAAAAFAYYYFPLARVTVYIESKGVEVEKVFKGDTNTTSFNLEEGLIPVKEETMTLERSGSASTTGQGKKGTKATGTIVFQHWSGASVVLPAGTVVVRDNLKYVTKAEITIQDAPYTTPEATPIEAMEVGDTYNMDTGKQFTVEGYDGNQLTAQNKAPITGGSSTTYQMLSQSDVDKLVKQLKEETFNEAKSDLENRNQGWEIIASTIKNELEGDISTDIAVGAEGNIFNLTLKTKTTALYFKKSEILNAKDSIMKKAAVDQNLFKEENGTNLELDNNIDTNITVEGVEGNAVTVKVALKGSVRPKVDTTKIQESLKGKKWEDGIKILNELGYSKKAPEAKYTPEIFPSFVRYFPTTQGKIIIEIQLEQTETVKES